MVACDVSWAFRIAVKCSMARQVARSAHAMDKQFIGLLFVTSPAMVICTSSDQQGNGLSCSLDLLCMLR